MILVACDYHLLIVSIKCPHGPSVWMIGCLPRCEDPCDDSVCRIAGMEEHPASAESPAAEEVCSFDASLSRRGG
jgi:hypothetical protein